jgi:hypothetical protein
MKRLIITAFILFSQCTFAGDLSPANFTWSDTSTTDASDDVNSNITCTKTCSEFGKFYGPTYQGVSLHQKVGVKGNTLISSGIGDMASLAVKDQDYYLGNQSVAGIWSTGNSLH